MPFPMRLPDFASTLAVAAALLLAAPAAALLDDPSFEAATDMTTISNSAWSLVANSPDGVDPSAMFFDFPVAASDGDFGVWFRSFEGQQGAGEPPADATLSQTVTSVLGGDYTLTFEAAREPFFLASSWTASLSSSGTGGSDVLELLFATFNDAGNMSSNPTTFQLGLQGVSPGDDLTVTIQMLGGLNNPGGPPNGFVDNFHLVRVPEPGPALLLVCGALLAVRAARGG